MTGKSILQKPMVLSRRSAVALLAGGVAVGFVGVGQALADEWPSRPVTMVVPYAPGASNDTFTRAISASMSEALGQPFVVENRAGAGGFTGTNGVVQAPADGYTFLEMPNSIVSFEHVMKVPFDIMTSLTAIGLIARAPVAMVVPSALPVETVADFIAYAKANPDNTFYGLAGLGTTQHQHGELFNRNAGLAIKGVNYKSSADAQTDLVAGRVQVMFVTIASVRGQIESGQVKLLAYSADNYPAGSPAAPTLAEVGVPNMEQAQIFWGLYGPPGLPEDLTAKMSAALNAALDTPSFKELVAKSGATPAPSTPAEFTAALDKEQAGLLDFLETVKLD